MTIQECGTENNFQLPIEISQCLKWITLNTNCYSSFLSSYLNRALVNFQVEKFKMKETCIIMEKVVNYLIGAYKLIDEFVNKFGFGQNSWSK